MSQDTAIKAKKPLRPAFSSLKDGWLSFIFVMPTLLILVFIAIYPLIWSLTASFTNRALDSRPDEIENIGTANYAEVLTNERAWERFVVTGQIVVPSVL